MNFTFRLTQQSSFESLLNDILDRHEMVLHARSIDRDGQTQTGTMEISDEILEKFTVEEIAELNSIK